MRSLANRWFYRRNPVVWVALLSCLSAALVYTDSHFSTLITGYRKWNPYGVHPAQWVSGISSEKVGIAQETVIGLKVVTSLVLSVLLGIFLWLAIRAVVHLFKCSAEVKFWREVDPKMIYESVKTLSPYEEENLESMSSYSISVVQHDIEKVIEAGIAPYYYENAITALRSAFSSSETSDEATEKFSADLDGYYKQSKTKLRQRYNSIVSKVKTSYREGLKSGNVDVAIRKALTVAGEFSLDTKSTYTKISIDVEACKGKSDVTTTTVVATDLGELEIQLIYRRRPVSDFAAFLCVASEESVELMIKETLKNCIRAYQRKYQKSRRENEVSRSSDSMHAKIAIEAYSNGSCVWVKIEDFAGGLKGRDFFDVTTPGYTQSEEGTGMGTYGVRLLSDLLDCQYHVFDNHIGGTSVYFLFWRSL